MRPILDGVGTTSGFRVPDERPSGKAAGREDPGPRGKKDDVRPWVPDLVSRGQKLALHSSGTQ